MEKGGTTNTKLVICIVSIIFLLFVTLHQHSLFSNTNIINSWQKNFWNRRTVYLHSEEAQLTKLHLSKLVEGKDLQELESTGVSCISDNHTEVCVINKPVIFDKQSLTIYIQSDEPAPRARWSKIKPYPRKEDQNAMDRVSPVHIQQGNIGGSMKPPDCQFRHNAPALVFSFGGFSENTFHDFNEIIIPLFITSRHFEGRVRFVVTDYRARWVRKFNQVLKKLSQFDVIDADSDETVHCFPAAVVGLRYHNNLEVNNSKLPRGNTMESFRQFLRDSYNLNIKTITPPLTKRRKPRLLLISRRDSRKLLQEDEMVKMMKKLGFQVQRASPNEMSNLGKFAHIVNSCDVMVGVHGAGLTNQVFLPNGSVVVQMVPLGLEWASEYYFGRPAINMGLKYVEYKVQPNETSLYDLYGPNDPVLSNPAAIWAKGYRAVKTVYIDSQDFRINLIRFRGTLLNVLKLLG